jgi:diguanylate cyclase (GGDEF)-like protein
MQSSVQTWVRSTFRSLAARVSFFVFAATLISALAVAWTSAQALRAFLRSKVEQKIPATVEQVRDRLDLWYAQRTLDVQVFARSAIVVDGLTAVARARSARPPKESAELERYLTYVLEGLPQYTSIFVLDSEGRLLLGVGHVPALGPELLRRLASVEEVEISDVLASREGGPIQVVTSTVRSRDGRRLLTLHAALPLGELEQQLAGGAPAGPGRTLVFDERGAFLAASRPVGAPAHPMNRALVDAGPGAVRDYIASDSLRVVGSALPFPRLRWTLVVEEDYDVAFAPIAAILARTLTLNLGIVLALAVLAFAVVAAMVRPLHALSDCARRLRDGEEDVELPVVQTSDEVGILARSFGEMVKSLKRANEVLEQLAITDGLTKIHNHRFFQDQLGHEIKRADRTGSPLALVLVDIDDFKALNDRCGHAAGDGVLERLAALLVVETRDQDLVARYGGEEFAILAPGTDRAGAVALAEKLRIATSESSFDVAGVQIAITVSVGVAVYHGDREAFFHEADRALYAAKGAGKDCVVAADAAAA